MLFLGGYFADKTVLAFGAFQAVCKWKEGYRKTIDRCNGDGSLGALLSVILWEHLHFNILWLVLGTSWSSKQNSIVLYPWSVSVATNDWVQSILLELGSPAWFWCASVIHASSWTLSGIDSTSAVSFKSTTPPSFAVKALVEHIAFWSSQ